MCAAILRYCLVAMVSFSLFLMGCWVWIDNRWAVIPSLTGEGQGSLDLDFIMDLLGVPGDPMSQDLMDPVKAAARDAALPLVAGNGDGDDNRREPFVARKRIGQQERLKKSIATTTWHERRTVAAYKDFGHLKVSPAGEASSIINSQLSASVPRPFQFILGGLAVF